MKQLAVSSAPLLWFHQIAAFRAFRYMMKQKQPCSVSRGKGRKKERKKKKEGKKKQIFSLDVTVQFFIFLCGDGPVQSGDQMVGVHLRGGEPGKKKVQAKSSYC